MDSTRASGILPHGKPGESVYRYAVGEIEAFQVESLGVYPKGDGMLYAEVYYRVETGEPFWPEDGGTIGDDGWVMGKCSRFDFVITPEEYQLKNKRLCS